MTALATISRTCEAGGCTNPVTGRSDKRTCSAACKKAVQRARLDEDDFVRALKVPPNDAYYLFVRDEKRDERRELSERATAACRCGDRRIVDRVDGHCAKCGHVPHGFDLLWRTAPTYLHAASVEADPTRPPIRGRRLPPHPWRIRLDGGQA